MIGRGKMDEIEAPKSKHQITNSKLKIPSPLPSPQRGEGGVRGSFEFKVWNLFGIWNFEMSGSEQ
jgi:hypothetical protein